MPLLESTQAQPRSSLEARTTAVDLEMTQESLLLLVSETRDVQNVHPALELLALSGSTFLRGTVSFDMGSGSRRIEDAYKLTLRFPNDYPASPPVVYETGGAIPSTFEHVFADGSCCLGAPADVRRRFREHRRLRRFIDEQVVPFLYSCSYWKRYGEMPFGELHHGYVGVLQYYMEFFRVDLPNTMSLLRLMADDIAPPLMKCPCRSGARLRDCHGPKIDQLRSVLHPREVERDLRQFIAAARGAGIHVPRAALPRRLLRRESKQSRVRRRP